MENEIIKREAGLIQSMGDAERAAQAMADSGYFQDAKQAAQAIVKVLAGHEMGFGPFASMNGIYIIQGRPTVSANLMASAVKRSGRYDYCVTEISETRCAILFFQNGEQIGESVFTIDDARRAGTKNLDKYARNMLFARAMSNGVRWYCPDVFNGSAVYTPDELGAVEDEDGRVVNIIIEKPTPKPVENVTTTTQLKETPGGMADIESAAASAHNGDTGPEEDDAGDISKAKTRYMRHHASLKRRGITGLPLPSVNWTLEQASQAANLLKASKTAIDGGTSDATREQAVLTVELKKLIASGG